MTWQLLLALSTTVPALLIALLLVLLIFYRRYRVFRDNRHRYLAGPRHIEHPNCQCFCCCWERDQDVAELRLQQ
ncbi:MAG: hypothetical protein RL120_02315 [Gammaproteobacteria bacterium]